MNYIEIKAPAKINIGLNVVSKRDDGFHNLNTLFFPIVDLYDILTFSPASNFEFHCDTDSIPDDDSNLVVKAKMLLERISGKNLDVLITLQKNIPSQAGLGGGSSDAAATLISLNEMFNLGIKYDRMIELSLELGSDVPFFIKSKPAIGLSRGEILKHIEVELENPLLLLNSGIKISTKDAFRNIVPKNRQFDYGKVISDGKIDFAGLRQFALNDFEQYAFSEYREISEIKEMLYRSGALFASMSGSGSTVFGIFADMKSASDAVKMFPGNYFSFLSSPHY